MRKKHTVSQERVKELFDYNHKTGSLVWRVDRTRGVKAGDPAGGLDREGYLQVGIDGWVYRLHRICFLHYYGYLPSKLDHINRCKTDNNISNLRSVTNSQNMKNRTSSSKSSSDYLGVSWKNKEQKWVASIQSNKVPYYLGSFKSETDAAKAYNDAAIRLHGDFANLNQC